MMFARAESGSIAVIPRNDATQPLFPLNLAPVRRCEVRPKNLVPDIRSLMGSLLVVVRQPFPVDVIKLVKAHAIEVVQALAFDFSDVALAIPIGHGRLNRCPKAFHLLGFPERPEPFAVFGIPVMDQESDLNAQILKPHGRIAGLLDNPFLIGVKRRRRHENLTASEMDKHQNVCINPSAPGKHGFGKEIGGDQRIHMGTDKQLPVARRMASALFRNGMVPCAFKNVPDGRKADLNAQLLKLAVKVLVAPSEVFGRKLQYKVHRRLRSSWPTRFPALLPRGTQPSPVGRRFDNHQHIGDSVIQQRTEPHQVGPLFLGRNNLGIIDAISQHPDLIFQQLKPGIVTGHEKPREKNDNYVKHTRKTAHIRLIPTGLILLFIKGLRGGIRFRTPRKIKELKNLLKQEVFSHPKAGFSLFAFPSQ